jgi:hypothetical protein
VDIMRGQTRKAALLMAAAILVANSVPASATAGCWNDTQLAAAKVRDLQSRLMVASLRCQAIGVEVVASYNQFVEANRETIQGANAVILAQFRTGYGSDAQTQYDRFVTALANIYGDDATSSAVCEDTAAIAVDAAAAQGDIGRLLAIEDRLGFAAQVPGGQCGISFASSREATGAGD